LSGTNPNIDQSTALSILMELADNLKLTNTTPQTEVLRSIFTQPGNRNTEPFATNTIPGRIYATNYDMGMNGYAYSDQVGKICILPPVFILHGMKAGHTGTMELTLRRVQMLYRTDIMLAGLTKMNG